MKSLQYSTFIFVFLLITSFSDKKVYNEIPNKTYHPIVLGQKLNYRADFRTYSIYLDTTTTERNGKMYILQTVADGNYKSYAYFRENNDTIIYIKPDQKSETVQIPARPTLGMTWYEGDSTWKYTITGISETLETPISRFTNCLIISSENIDKSANPNHYRLYQQYYQRGRGYVGSKVGGLIYTYLIVE